MISKFLNYIRKKLTPPEPVEQKETRYDPPKTSSARRIENYTSKKTHKADRHQDQLENFSKDRLSKPGKRKKRKRKPEKTENDRVSLTDTAASWNPSEFQVPVREGNVRFHDLHLPEPLMHAIFDLGFEYCTPIQAEILPDAIAGKDATGRAQTGTGKTAAFLIAILKTIIDNPGNGKRPVGTPRSLILAPTRELAIQIAKDATELAKYCRVNVIEVFGGMDYRKQKKMLQQSSIDIMVATPGRLLDFYRQKDADLSSVEILVIDEADRMLDMGFIPDIRKIIHATPPKNQRQTLFFSATLTEDIIRLAGQWTKNAIKVEIEPEQVEVDTVDQIVYIVETHQKYALLYHVITRQNLKKVLVFCNRKDETRKLNAFFQKYGIQCAVLSGDVSQNRRLKTLENFRSNKLRVLVATDVAGRGIHIEDISHVINYTIPRDPENYVHRIGRTGRAGAAGISISFACEEDSFYIPAIEQYLGHELHATYPEEEWLDLPPPPKRRSSKRKKRRRRYPRSKKKPDISAGEGTESG